MWIFSPPLPSVSKRPAPTQPGRDTPQAARELEGKTSCIADTERQSSYSLGQYPDSPQREVKCTVVNLSSSDNGPMQSTSSPADDSKTDALAEEKGQQWVKSSMEKGFAKNLFSPEKGMARKMPSIEKGLPSAEKRVNESPLRRRVEFVEVLKQTKVELPLKPPRSPVRYSRAYFLRAHRVGFGTVADAMQRHHHRNDSVATPPQNAVHSYSEDIGLKANFPNRLETSGRVQKSESTIVGGHCGLNRAPSHCEYLTDSPVDSTDMRAPLPCKESGSTISPDSDWQPATELTGQRREETSTAYWRGFEIGSILKNKGIGMELPEEPPKKSTSVTEAPVLDGCVASRLIANNQDVTHKHLREWEIQRNTDEGQSAPPASPTSSVASSDTIFDTSRSCSTVPSATPDIAPPLTYTRTWPVVHAFQHTGKLPFSELMRYERNLYRSRENAAKRIERKSARDPKETSTVKHYHRNLLLVDQHPRHQSTMQENAKESDWKQTVKISSDDMNASKVLQLSLSFDFIDGWKTAENQMHYGSTSSPIACAEQLHLHPVESVNPFPADSPPPQGAKDRSSDPRSNVGTAKARKKRNRAKTAKCKARIQTIRADTTNFKDDLWKRRLYGSPYLKARSFTLKYHKPWLSSGSRSPARETRAAKTATKPEPSGALETPEHMLSDTNLSQQAYRGAEEMRKNVEFPSVDTQCSNLNTNTCTAEQSKQSKDKRSYNAEVTRTTATETKVRTRKKKAPKNTTKGRKAQTDEKNMREQLYCSISSSIDLSEKLAEQLRNMGKDHYEERSFESYRSYTSSLNQRLADVPTLPTVPTQSPLRSQDGMPYLHGRGYNSTDLLEMDESLRGTTIFESLKVPGGSTTPFRLPKLFKSSKRFEVLDPDVDKGVGTTTEDEGMKFERVLPPISVKRVDTPSHGTRAIPEQQKERLPQITPPQRSVPVRVECLSSPYTFDKGAPETLNIKATPLPKLAQKNPGNAEKAQKRTTMTVPAKDTDVPDGGHLSSKETACQQEKPSESLDKSSAMTVASLSKGQGWSKRHGLSAKKTECAKPTVQKEAAMKEIQEGTEELSLNFLGENVRVSFPYDDCASVSDNVENTRTKHGFKQPYQSKERRENALARETRIYQGKRSKERHIVSEQIDERVTNKMSSPYLEFCKRKARMRSARRTQVDRLHEFFLAESLATMSKETVVSKSSSPVIPMKKSKSVEKKVSKQRGDEGLSANNLNVRGGGCLVNPVTRSNNNQEREMKASPLVMHS